MILYSAPSSYYSMIARLALQESRVDYHLQFMDIHLAKEQLSSWYAAINPSMTVPTLMDNSHLWTSSRAILEFSASHAGAQWCDSDSSLAPYIEGIVAAHYGISIEKLTFGKTLTEHSLARKLVPFMLRRMIRQLQTKLQTSTDLTAIQNKIILNQERLAYFTEGNLAQKFKNQREEVQNYMSQLPQPGTFLFGEKPSSADIVTAVLFGRLKMIGEYELVTSMPALSEWFDRIQNRPAFKNSDVWLTFNPWRILMGAIKNIITSKFKHQH